jgi:acyl-CoA dehydrogenase
MQVAIDQAAACSGLRAVASHADAIASFAEPVLASAALFARDVLSPLNRVGDASSSTCTSGGVVTAPGFREAYRQFCDSGWPSLSAPEAYGGQGLPLLISAAVTEMWGGANLAFAMCPEAAVGAIEALRAHASRELRDLYLPKLASGEWTAAMCLTEPQAGSDLSTLRTVARPDGDTWRLSGTKIYISWGDHDLSENIVHLVLARTPEAPEGIKGVSLYLVPKHVPSAAGVLEPNDIHAVSVEHKMGIRASPTCVMSLGDGDGARGWLIGNLHNGIGCMFTMMNHMRLGVGLHSTGVAERALQLARTYAQERRQGRDRAGNQRPIIEHADVRRMLLTMKALVHAARCLAYTAAATLDLAHLGSKSERTAANERLGLLTPVVKAWCTETAVEVASLGVQIHGGMGYVDESEISQLYRDARIGPIFEGTNYIQAQDLLLRKVIRDRGVSLESLLRDIEASADCIVNRDAPIGALRSALLEGCKRMRALTSEIISAVDKNSEEWGAIAYPFLQWLGVLAGGWQWALTVAPRELRSESSAFDRALLDTAVFYAMHVMPRMQAHEAVVARGTSAVMTPHGTTI